MYLFRKNQNTIALWIWITWGLVMPSIVFGNPTVDPRDQLNQGFLLALISLALVIEIIVTSLILIFACRIDQRLTLVAALTLLNVASFAVFMLYLHPKIGSVTVTELLIWVTETYVLTHITRWLGERPLSFRLALLVTFIGNLFSYLVGRAA